MGGARVLGVASALAAGVMLSCPAKGPGAPRHEGMVDPGMASACLFLKSCHTAMDFSRYGTVSMCVWSQTSGEGQPWPSRAIRTAVFSWTAVDCVDSAAECADVAKCVSGEPDSCKPALEGGPQPAPECHGAVRTGCDPVLGLAMNCSVFGQTCLTTDSGVAGCGQFFCDPGAPQACVGNLAQFCSLAGTGSEADCGALGERCVMKNGFPTCVGSGPSCTSSRCDGSDLILCDGSFERRILCNELPITSVCQANGDTVGCVPSPALACDATKYTDRCEGTSLVFCDGEEERLDCSVFGFSRCVERGDTGAVCE